MVLATRSRYTLCEPWPDGRGILLNAFSGAVDVVPRSTVAFVREHDELVLDEDDPLHRSLLERGYYVGSRELEDAYARTLAANAKKQARAHDQPKYMFGLTLRCNLACDYCWQVIEHGTSRQRTTLMTDEMVKAAFDYIERDLEGRDSQEAFISLFGGEPLIDRPDFHRLVRVIGDETARRGMHLHFTTNGRDLGAYREEICRFQPSIQVTVDGAEVAAGAVMLKRDGQRLVGLFETMAEILEQRQSPLLMVRFLVNTANLEEFVALADVVFSDPRFAEGFNLAVAPVQNKSDLMDPSIPPKFKLLARLVEALRDRSYSSEIAYVDWRSLSLFSQLRMGAESLPASAFFHCEANVNLTCFDHDGLLYACYEAMGTPDLSIGRYWPEVHIDEAHLAQYRERSAFSMPQCTECAVSPICGGGCEVRGIKKNGEYMQPYCDDLHREVQLVLRNWQDLSALMIGGHDDHSS